MNEAELIDRYIDALNRDPNAAPPPSLDADTAAFVRTLVQSEQRPAPGSTAQDRVWHRAMSLAENPLTPGDNRRASSRGNHIEQRVTLLKSNEHVNMDDDMSIMSVLLPASRTAPATRSPASRYLFQYTLTIAAALFMLALLGGILIEMGNNPKIGYPAAVSLETEEPTAEPPPTCETGLDYMAQGEASIISGDYAAALVAYSCSIQVDPGNADAYLLRGGLAAGYQDYDQLAYDLYSFSSRQVAGTDIAEMSITKMLRPLGDAIVARPDDPVLYMLRGLISFDLGIFIRDFDRLIELDPDNPVGYLYGWIAAGERVYTADFFQKVIELAPDSMLIPAGMNAALFGENVEFALPYFDRAIQLNPEHPFAYEQRGIAHVMLGDMAEAARDFYQHIQNHHTDVFDEEPLTLGEPLIFDADTGAVYRFRFTPQAGQKLDIVVGRENTDLIGEQYPPTVVILDPQDNLVSAPYVVENWPGEGQTALTPIRGFEIPESGDYTVIVTANSTGSLRIETVEAQR